MKVAWLVYGNHPINTGIAVELGKKCDLTLLMRKRHEDEDFPKNNYKIIYLRVIEKAWNALLFPVLVRNIFVKAKISLPPLIYFKDLSKTLNELKPDVIVSNLEYMPASWQAAKYSSKNNIPFIIQTETQRLPGYKLGRVFTKFILHNSYIFNKAKLVLPWTSDGVKFMKQNLEPRNTNKIHLLPPGINNELYNTLGRKKNSNVFTILMIARMLPYKNHKDLILALSILKKKGYEFKAKFRGDGSYKSEVEKLIKEHELIIEMLPPSPNMVNEYWKSDVLVLPSFNEAVGMVVPEAMACGMTTIVSDTVGAKTYIKEEENGFIYRTGDYEELAEKLEYLHKNKDILASYKFSAEMSIIEDYTNKRIAQKLFEYIKKASEEET